MKLGYSFWAVLILVGPAMLACNEISGANDVTFSDDDDGGSSGVTTSGNGSNGSSGQGGTVGSGGTGTSTTGAGGTGTGGQGGSPLPPCEYPAGPYGVAQGQTVPPSLSWQGYLPGASSPSTITIDMFFDCDGRKGINAVVVDTSQYG